MIEDFLFEAKPLIYKGYNVPSSGGGAEAVPEWIKENVKRGNINRVEGGGLVKFKVKTLNGLGQEVDASVGQWILEDPSGCLSVVDSVTLNLLYNPKPSIRTRYESSPTVGENAI